MIVLSDAEATAALASPVSLAGRAQEPQFAAQPDETETRLWQALGGGARVVRHDIAAPAALAAWSHIIVVRDAPRSQFDALRELAGAPDSPFDGVGSLRGGIRSPREGLRSRPGGVAGIAIAGRGCHGQHGRTWLAEPGNLHLSAACDPRLAIRAMSLPLTALPAVVLVEALRELGSWRSEPSIKWINDVVMGDKKVGGVLAAVQSHRGWLRALTVGIGLNVERSPAVPPSVFVPAIGNLREFAVGSPPSLADCANACLRGVERWLQRLRREGAAPLLAAYRRHNLLVGRDVLVWPTDVRGALNEGQPMQLPPPSRAGRVVDIDDDLALRLAGQNEPVRAGRLALRDAVEAAGRRDRAG